MVHGRWKRAASTMASNCVLSPISLTAIVADRPDVEVARLRMRNVEARYRRSRRHREILGQSHTDLLRLQDLEQSPLHRVLRTRRVARRRPDALVGLGDL